MVGKILKGALLPLLPFVFIGFVLYLFKDKIVSFFSVPDLKASSDLKPYFELDYTSGLSKPQTIIVVNQLLDAFNSKEPFYGTDEVLILSVFKSLNSSDFLKVYDVFGKRPYNGNNSPPEGLFRVLDDYQDRDIIYWLRSELDPLEDMEVYKFVRSVVTPLGFSF